MDNVKYFLRIFYINYIGIPLVTSIVFFVLLANVLSSMDVLILIAIISIVNAIFSFITIKMILKKSMPDKFLPRYLPFLAPLTIQLIVWTMCMVISGGFYGADIFLALQIVELPFLPLNIIISFSYTMSLMFYIPLIFNIVSLLIFTILERIKTTRVILPKKTISAFTAVILVCSITGGIVSIKRSENVLPPTYGYDHGNGYSSVDLSLYDLTNSNNILPTLNKPSTFTIENKEDMLVLDGAEAAYPVYSAFANACYNNIQIFNKKGDGTQPVSFTNTIYAFENLIKGDVDIFFGAAASKSQVELAEKAGKKLVLTPIGKEGFVFFVGKDNPIENVTIEQIKDIYSGKVKNWNEFSDIDDKIIAFQRPENSGSQTILQKIMGDTPIQKPLKEEYISGMGGVSEKVASFRNTTGALGYSFRFFTTSMAENLEKIKLLSINGIAPTTENIADNSYPFTVNLYAITVEDNNNKNIRPFLDWMVGEQGQELVEKVGYIKN